MSLDQKSVRIKYDKNSVNVTGNIIEANYVLRPNLDKGTGNYKLIKQVKDFKSSTNE